MREFTSETEALAWLTASPKKVLFVRLPRCRQCEEFYTTSFRSWVNSVQTSWELGVITIDDFRGYNPDEPGIDLTDRHVILLGAPLPETYLNNLVR